MSELVEAEAEELEVRLDDQTQLVFKQKGLEVLKMLSDRVYNQVFKARQTSDDRMYAVKVMFLDKLQELEPLRIKKKFLDHEISALAKLQHPNIVKVIDIYRFDDRMFIIMELAARGDIVAYIKNLGRGLTEPEAGKLFVQVLEALQYLHQEQSTAHRDISVDNILLDEDMNAKLANFHFATKIEDNKPCDTFCGTLPYDCPQIIRRQLHNGFAADMWAMGVTLFAMLNNKFLYHCLKEDSDTVEPDYERLLREQINWPEFVRSRYTSEFSRECKELQEGLVHPEEAQRWTVVKAMECEWVKNRGQY